jgi:hypothetical protein
MHAPINKNIMLTPMSRKLVITGHAPKVKRTNKEGDAARQRREAGKQCCSVEYDDAMLTTLLRLGLLSKENKEDREAVGEAVRNLWAQVDPNRPIRR